MTGTEIIDATTVAATVSDSDQEGPTLAMAHVVQPEKKVLI